MHADFGVPRVRVSSYFVDTTLAASGRSRQEDGNRVLLELAWVLIRPSVMAATQFNLRKRSSK